jgi:hypothetical protein
MATVSERENFDFEEQRVRILRAIEEVENLASERRKLAAEELKLASERLKLDAEQYKFDAERGKLTKDTGIAPWLLLAQGIIAGAALLGAALALLKYLVA